MPAQIGLSRVPEVTPATIERAWLDGRRVAVAFPDGGISRGTSFSWQNAGTGDDTPFLVALADGLRRDLGVRRVVLAGYSAGGMMAGRVWCTSGATRAFDAVVTVSGPPVDSVAAACAPADPGPALAIVGSKDEAIIAGAPWDAPAWRLFGGRSTFSRTLASDPATLAQRARILCGGVPSEARTVGATTRWDACDGRLGLIRVEDATHDTNTIANGLEPGSRLGILDTIVDFAERVGP